MLQPKPTPSYSFTRDSRAKKLDSLLLPSISNGPAMYNITTELNQSSSLLFEKYSDRQPLKTENLPGIGYYDPKPLNSQNSVTFSKSKRINLTNIESPGPGHYQLPMSNIKGGKLGNNKRQFQNYDNGCPGIGSYSINQQFSKPTTNQPTFSQVGAKRPRFKQFPSPGPTSYETAQDEWPRQLKIAQSKRSWSYIQRTVSPGPGAYSIESLKNVKKQKSHHVVKNNQSKRKTEDIKADQKEKLIKLMESKTKGSQSDRQHHKSNGISFKKSIRKNEFLDVFNQFLPQPFIRSPGPAQQQNQYKSQIQKSKNKGMQFNRQKKQNLKVSENPGVGSYGELPQFGKKYVKKVPKKVQTVNYQEDLKNLQNQQIL